MRSWIILFETIISIIILTATYLVFFNYYRNLNKNVENVDFSIDIENFRGLVEQCYPDKIYAIYNISSNEIIVCKYGSIGTLNDLNNYTFYKKYFFSGYKTYDPFILFLYK